jgi:hypothetical protein
MIDGLYGTIKEHKSERHLLETVYSGWRPVDFVFGPWKSKVVIEFDGFLPDWVVEAANSGGKVRIIP